MVETELAARSTFVLPLASIIETGNHISQAAGERFVVATEFGKLISLTAKATSPWAAFTDQAGLWDSNQLERLAREWPNFDKSGLSIADATIKDVAEYYVQAGFSVEIVTGDTGLKAYEPTSGTIVPRRRQR